MDTWKSCEVIEYKLTLKPLLFDCATFVFVYFHYYANRYFSGKLIHQSHSSISNLSYFWRFQGIFGLKFRKKIGVTSTIGIKNKLFIYKTQLEFRTSLVFEYPFQNFHPIKHKILAWIFGLRSPGTDQNFRKIRGPILVHD